MHPSSLQLIQASNDMGFEIKYDIHQIQDRLISPTFAFRNE